MGFWEMTLIFIILLVVVGPDRLPPLVRTLGFWVGKARRMVASVRAEVEEELKLSEVKRSISQQGYSEEFKRLAEEVQTVDRQVKGEEFDTKDSRLGNPDLSVAGKEELESKNPSSHPKNFD